MTALPDVQADPPEFHAQRLTKDQIAAGLAWIEEAKRRHKAILDRRGGRVLPSSWRLIRRDREQRPPIA